MGFYPKTFYYGKKRQEKHLGKPKGMGSEDIPITARTAAQAGIPYIEHRTPRVLAKDLTDEQAAIMIQRQWAARKARLSIRRMIAHVYQKVYDAETKQTYYYNTRTGESRADKPVLLGSSDLEYTPRSMAAAGIKPPKKTPRYTAADLTDEEAAVVIQQAFRRKRARHRLHKLLSKQFEKVWDANSKKFYYIDKRDGTVSWDKPKGMGSEDIPITARTAAQAGIPYIEHRTPRVLAKDLTDEQAAIMIQRQWAARKARLSIRRMIAHVYQKVYDAETKQTYYYYNLRELMKVVDQASLAWFKRPNTDTPVYGCCWYQAPKKTPRYTAADLTDEEAAIRHQR